MRKALGLILLLAAFGVLIPGVTQPILILDAWVDKAELGEFGKQSLAENPDLPDFLVTLSARLIDDLNLQGQLKVFTRSRSIYGTVQQLYRSGHMLVAVLIAMFSMVIPAIKLTTLLFAASFPRARLSQPLARFERAIGKWSMADVFVIAIMVAYLAAVATEDTEDLFTLQAQFSTGFYYFLGYCVLAIAGSQLLSTQPVSPPADTNSG